MVGFFKKKKKNYFFEAQILHFETIFREIQNSVLRNFLHSALTACLPRWLSLTALRDPLGKPARDLLNYSRFWEGT